MQTIYSVNIRDIAPFFDSCAARLRPERKKKMLEYRFFDDRLRSLAGGLLMEQAAGRQEIRHTVNGKPFLSDGPHISLSHSGDFVCLAVCASAPVGLDIERHRNQNFAELGKAAFHPIEYDFFMRDPGPVRFYDLLTLKESYVKMIGAGFLISPSSYCVLPEKMILPSTEKIFIRNLNFSELGGYSLALCSQEPIDASFVESASNLYKKDN